MLVSSPHQPADKLNPSIASGLRSLLVAVPPPSGGVVVVTRAMMAAAASSHGCGSGVSGVQESRDRAGITGGDVDKVEKEEEDVMIKAEDDDEDTAAGCWVSYGRREPTMRRLPPPIPSLLARGALWRTRTRDGRLVIRIAPVVRRECIRARRHGGRLLTMALVEHNHGDAGTPEEKPDDNTTAPAAPVIGSEGIGEEEPAAEARPEMLLPIVVPPPPRVPSAGCFEDVLLNYGSSTGGATSLHQMPILISRMVH